VGKGFIRSADMDVIGRAQIFPGNGRAFQMPARTDIAPLRLGINPPFQLSQTGPFQKREVRRRVLFVIIQIDRPAGPGLGRIDIGQTAVVSQFGDVEINGVQLLIGISAIDQLFNDLERGVNIFGGSYVDIVRTDLQKPDILQKYPQIFIGIIREIHARLFRPLERLVAAIDDIDDMFDGVALEGQIAAQQVGHHQPPVISQMRSVMNGRAAGAQPHLLRVQRTEKRFPALDRVVKADRRQLLFDREQFRAQVALSAVRENDHDRAFFHLTGLLGRDKHGRAGAHAGEDAFFPGQPAGHFKSVFVQDIHLFIQTLLVVDPGAVGLAHVFEALDLMLQVRLDADDLNAAIEFLEPLRNAHRGAGGSERDHHGGDPALGLIPDFLRRPEIMGPDVIGVVELIGAEILFRVFPKHPVSDLDGAVRPLRRGGKDQLRAHRPQNFFALFAGRFGHGQAQLVAFRRGHHGQSDAGIAAGRLQNDPAGFQVAPFFGVFDHAERRSVFNGSPGIRGLQLGQNRDLFIRIQLRDFHQRRVADAIHNAFIHVHHHPTLRSSILHHSFSKQGLRRRLKKSSRRKYNGSAVHLGQRNFYKRNPFFFQDRFFPGGRRSFDIAPLFIARVDLQRNFGKFVSDIFKVVFKVAVQRLKHLPPGNVLVPGRLGILPHNRQGRRRDFHAGTVADGTADQTPGILFYPGLAVFKPAFKGVSVFTFDVVNNHRSGAFLVKNG